MASNEGEKEMTESYSKTSENAGSKGFLGRILHIDLSSGKSEYETLEESFYRKYLSRVGLGSNEAGRGSVGSREYVGFLHRSFNRYELAFYRTIYGSGEISSDRRMGRYQLRWKFFSGVKTMWCGCGFFYRRK